MAKMLVNPRESKKFGIQFGYILDCIQSEDYTLSTDKEKIDYFFRCFETEFNHEFNKRRYPSEQDRIAEYLQGLPSCCTVEFYNSEIAEIGKSWGFCQTEKKTDQFVKRWFSVLAFRLIQLKTHFQK